MTASFWSSMERNDLMICPAPTSVVRGNSASYSQPTMMTRPKPAGRPATNPPALANPLERLAQLIRSNDRLLDDLATSRQRIVAALTYLDKPGCNARFASAHLDRCRNRHAAILAQLRANRIEALDLLGAEPGSTDRPAA